MRTNLLLTKALIAVALLLGGVSSVWAETETTTLLTIDYSTVTTPAWTVIGGSVSITNGTAKHTQDNGGGNRSAYLDFGLASNIDDNWTVEFDAALKPGSDRNDQQITVAGSKTTYANNTSATGYMYFAVKEESNGGTSYTVKIGDTDVATGVTLSNGTTYHFKVTYDGTSAVTAYIDGTKYSGTVAIDNVGKLRGLHSCVARYNGAITYDNIVVTKEVEAGNVEVPTASITAVDGINRTISFACATEGVTFSYSTDGENFTEGNSVVISENTTIYVKATKGTVSAVSEGLEFGAGTSITLNTPTWTKTGYSAGVSTVTLSSDQSSLLLSPTADIYYQINGGEAVKYTSPIGVNDGDVLTYYATATGYINSSESSVTAVAPCSNPILWTETYNGIVTANNNFSLGSVVISEVNGTKYYNFYYNEGATLVSQNVLTNNLPVSGQTKSMLRSNGIYAVGGMNMAIIELEAGDYVTINGVYGNGEFIITGNSTDLAPDEWNSIYGSSYRFTAKRSGTCRFTLTRYGYIQNITVQRALPATVPATMGANGFTTFASEYSLDLANLPEGLKAYTATLDKATITFAECTQAVAAGTGLLLEGTAGITYDIPVVADGATVSDNALTGVTTVTPLKSDDTNYIFAMKKATKADDPLSFAPLTSESEVNFPAGKAYIEVPASAFESTARALVLTFDDATSVKELKNSRIEELKSYYNLNGQRVSQPSKGLYIVNGKKVVIK